MSSSDLTQHPFAQLYGADTFAQLQDRTFLVDLLPPPLPHRGSPQDPAATSKKHPKVQITVHIAEVPRGHATAEEHDEAEKENAESDEEVEDGDFAVCLEVVFAPGQKGEEWKIMMFETWLPGVEDENTSLVRSLRDLPHFLEQHGISIVDVECDDGEQAVQRVAVYADDKRSSVLPLPFDTAETQTPARDIKVGIPFLEHIFQAREQALWRRYNYDARKKQEQQVREAVEEAKSAAEQRQKSAVQMLAEQLDGKAAQARVRKRKLQEYMKQAEAEHEQRMKDFRPAATS